MIYQIYISVEDTLDLLTGPLLLQVLHVDKLFQTKEVQLPPGYTATARLPSLSVPILCFPGRLFAGSFPKFGRKFEGA